MKNNIFDNTQFGDKFLTEGNITYLFIGESNYKKGYYGVIKENGDSPVYYTSDGIGPHSFALGSCIMLKPYKFDNIIKKLNDNSDKMGNIDKAIEVLTAFKEGKIIEFLSSATTWSEYKLTFNQLLTDLSNHSYDNFRVAKEPTYRPYASADEFLKDFNKHKYLYACGQYHTPILIDDDGIVTHDIENGSHWTWKKLYESFVYEDKTPCGVIED